MGLNVLSVGTSGYLATHDNTLSIATEGYLSSYALIVIEIPEEVREPMLHLAEDPFKDEREDKKERILREDEEILLIIKIFLETWD